MDSCPFASGDVVSKFKSKVGPLCLPPPSSRWARALSGRSGCSSVASKPGLGMGRSRLVGNTAPKE